MEIRGSALISTSQHQFSREESLTRIVREREVKSAAIPSNTPTDSPTPLITQAQAQVVPTPEITTPEPTVKASKEEDDLLESGDARLMLLKALVEALTGKEIDQGIQPITTEQEGEATDLPANSTAPAQAEEAIDNRQFETITFTHYQVSEYEYSSVNIGGTLLIDGEGGEELLDINLNVTMERSYEASLTELSVRQGRLTDPLVINFNGETVALADQTTQFDLNSDGTEDDIATLSSNSAYLALDKNGDGIINNGSELFGPSTNNGFAELASYDQDGNGFIDNNDEIFAQLQLYRPGDQYQQSLTATGIGALHTSGVSSPMRLTDAQNNSLGQVQSTGFYINEDRSVGSIQQIDLVV